LQKRSPSEIS